MNRIALVLLAIALAGCPSFAPGGAYRCDQDSDCPTSRRCVLPRHVCEDEVDPVPDGGGTPDESGPDAGSTPDVCDGKPHTMTFKQGPALDLLWIVDNSGSMAPHQTAIAEHAAAILGGLEAHGVDYQLGVTSTDVDDRGAFYPLQGEEIRIVSPFSPEAPQLFARNATTGIMGSGTEQGLSTAKLALTSPVIDDPLRNKGFLRDEATLVVVVVSDEDDSSPSDVSEYATFFKGLHPGHPERVKAVAITGLPPNGCAFAGSAVPVGSRYVQLVTQLGGASESICTPDWVKPLASVADAAPVRRHFRLGFEEFVSVQNVVRITSGGTRVNVASWQLDQATKTVSLDPALAPARGERLEIGYTRTCQ